MRSIRGFRKIVRDSESHPARAFSPLPLRPQGSVCSPRHFSPASRSNFRLSQNLQIL